MRQKITLSNCFANAMHQPRTNSGYALYTRVANSDQNDEYEEYVRKAEQDSEYISKSQKTYNSPENIRRIFLTGKGVTIHYYVDPIVNGDSCSKCAKQVSLNLDGEASNLLQVAEKIANYETSYSQYLMSKAIDKNAKEPTQYSIEGSFNFAAHPYTLNNIEEIYFDWTILLSTDILPLVASMFGVQSTTQFANFMLNSSGSSYKECPQLIELFVQSSMGGAKNIEKRFPRLKTIAMISNLASVDESLSNNRQLSANDLSLTTWLDSYKEQLMNAGSCLILEAKVHKEFTTEFIIKTSTYKFDAEVLEPRINKFKAEIEDIIRQRRYGNTEEKTEDFADEDNIVGEASELEQLLVSLNEKAKGLDINTLKFVYNYGTAGKADWKDILRGFSKSNRTKYASALGITM